MSLFRTSGSSSSDIELESVESFKHTKHIPLGRLDQRVVKRLDCLHNVIRVLAVISLVLLVVTIVFLALAQMNYIHPLLALGTLGGCIGTFAIIKVIDCIQQSVARQDGLDLQEDYYTVKQPKKKTSSD